MIKKNTIIFITVLLLTSLNTAPFFLIICTETNGSSHLENVFNRCCNPTIFHSDHRSMNHPGIFFGVSHCKCSADSSSVEYIIPNSEKSIFHEVFNDANSEYNVRQNQEIIFQSLTTESPPLSIDLVRTTVLLI